MAKDGSAALGAPQIAGTHVSPKGFTRKTTSRPTGTTASVGATGTLAVMAPDRDIPDIPRLRRAYLAVSEQEIAIVKTASLAWNPKPAAQALAIVPRSEIANVYLDKGYLSKLALEFTNGSIWQFEVARAYRRDAEELVETLGGVID